MPPRKSDVAKVAVGDEGVVATPEKGTPAKKDDGISIEDLNLPKSIVTRLAKGVLPPSAQIQGNAMLALSKSATVFVSYLAANANEHAQSANRKTIAPADVFKALEELEFDFKDRLEAELAKFNEIQTDKRNAYRKKVAADKATKGEAGPETERNEADGGDDEPAAKKARLDPDTTLPDGEEEDMADETIDDGEEEHVEDDDVEEEEEVHEEVEEPQDEEHEETQVDDEVLDNGEDSN
jgi:DNA polymerase epsilon subunit 3